MVLYPAVALLEGTNVSVGRGTDRAFEVLGAPWMDPEAMLERVRGMQLSGVELETAEFVPRSGPYRGRRCRGVALRVTDRDAFEPVRAGLALALHATHAARWDPTRLVLLVGDRAVTESLLTGADLATLERTWQAELEAFRTRRTPHLLY
jgi:uncharacterized protein YbbC (DUF1343 family)